MIKIKDFFSFDNLTLIWSNFFTILIFNFGNFLSMLFTFFIARNLIPEVYGEYITLSSIIAFVVTPIFFVSLFLSNKISQIESKEIKEKIINRVFIVSGLIISIILVLFYFAQDLIINKFKINNFDLLEIFILLVLITLLNHIFSGIFQGYKKYYHYSILSNITFVIKFLGVVVSIYFFRLDLNIIFTIILLAYLIQFFITTFYINKIIYLKKILKLNNSIFNFDYFNRKDWVFISVVMFGYIINFFDILVFRYVFDVEASSNYNVSSLIAKIPLIAAASITNILVPELNDKKAPHFNKISIAFIFITSIYFFYYFFISLFGENFISILFGISYINSLIFADNLIIYFYFSNLITVFLLALSKRFSLYLILIIISYFIIVISLLIQFSFDPNNFINILIYSSAIFLLFIILIFFKKGFFSNTNQI